MEDKGLLNANLNKGIDLDTSMRKIGVLGVLGVSLAFCASLFFNFFVVDAIPQDAVLATLAAIAFLVVFLVNIFFIKSATVTYSLVLLECVAFAAGFYNAISFTLVLGTIITFIILSGAVSSGRDSIQNMLRIRFWHIGKIVVPKAILALALFMSVVSYANIEKIVVHEKRFFVSAGFFEKLLEEGTALVTWMIPEVDFSKSLGEITKNIATRQIKESPETQKLSSAMKSQLVTETEKDLQARIAAYFGVLPGAVNLNNKSSEAIYELTAQKFNGLDQDGKQGVTFMVVVIIFLSILGIILPLRLLVTLLAVILYEILLALQFAAVTLEGRSREIIVLK